MAADPFDAGSSLRADLFSDDAHAWDPALPADERHSLSELVNRVLDRGVVISGDIVISVAGVDLVYLGLSAVLTSVSTARRIMEQRGDRLPGE